MGTKVYIGPDPVPAVLAAVSDAGGISVPLDQADAVIWMDANPDRLPPLPDRVRWVQLPGAGVNRWLERRTVYVGSFPIVLAAFGGLELYGLNGALLFVLGAVLIVSIISEIGPEEVAEALAAPMSTPR